MALPWALGALVLALLPGPVPAPPAPAPSSEAGLRGGETRFAGVAAPLDGSTLRRRTSESPAEDSAADGDGKSETSGKQASSADAGEAAKAVTEHAGEEEHAQGGEHAGEEEAHGEGHGHRKVSSKALTVAVLLMLFVAFDMFLLYLISARDPDIRSYSYKMICTTVSIFCAVLFNQALFSFFFKQLLSAPPPRGLVDMNVQAREKFIVGLLVFLFFFFGMNGLMFKNRVDADKMYAIRNLFAHITAWAGITLFGNIQVSRLFRQNILMALAVLPIAVVSLMGLGWVSALWRSRRDGPPGPGGAAFRHSLSVAGEEPDELSPRKRHIPVTWAFLARGDWRAYTDPQTKQLEDAFQDFVHKDRTKTSFNLVIDRQRYTVDWSNKTQMKQINCVTGKNRAVVRIEQQEKVTETSWLESAREAEDEAAGLILSFLVHQVVYFHVTNRIADVHGAHEVQTQMTVNHLFLWALGFTVALCFLTTCKQKIVDVFETGHKRQLWARAINVVQTFLSMGMAWCSCVAGIFMTVRFMPDEREMAHIVAAFVLSIFSVACIIAMDKLADIVSAERQQRNEYSNKAEGATNGTSQEESRDADAAQPLVGSRDSEDLGEESRALQGALVLQDLFTDVLSDDTAQEKALRTVIGGFGVLVGLAWDKAFDASVETAVEGVPYLAAHPVIAKAGLVVVLGIIVVPAWLMYIVPAANKSREQHKSAIKLEEAVPMKAMHMKRVGTTNAMGSQLLNTNAMSNARS